jgi:hypothetical protein
MTDVIRFTAEIIKVQTMQDMAIRCTFDLPENSIETAMLLMDAKRRGALLEVAAIPIDMKNIQESNGKSQLGEGQKRKSEWTPQEGPGINGNS